MYTPQSAKEQVLVRVRPSARRNGVHLAVDGAHQILDRALPESLYVCHLHDHVIGVVPTSHKCKSGLDQEFILQKEIHVETAHHIDDLTPYDVGQSSHEPFVSHGSFDYLDGIYVSGRVLVPQLTRQLRDLGISTSSVSI